MIFDSSSQEEDIIIETLYPLSKWNDVRDAKAIIEKYGLQDMKSEEVAQRVILEAMDNADAKYIISILELFPNLDKAELQKHFWEDIESGYEMATINVFDGLLKNIIAIADTLWIPMSALYLDSLMQIIWDDFGRFYADYPPEARTRFAEEFSVFFWKENLEKIFLINLFTGELGLWSNKNDVVDFAENHGLSPIFQMSDTQEKAKKVLLSHIKDSQALSLSREEALRVKGIMDVCHLTKEWITSKEVLQETGKWGHILSIVRLFHE